jgi:hypothetical protein
MIEQLAITGFGSIFVGVGLLLVNQGRKERAQSERIAETETTAVRQLQPGTVEVKGVARPAEEAGIIKSPISEGDALATYVEVEEYESSGQHGGSWKTKHEDTTAVPMVVDDGTGEVRVVLPADGEVNVETITTKVGPGDEPSEPIKRYLEAEAAVDEGSRGSFGPLNYGDDRRYSEGMIEPGEEIYVLGRAREEQGDWGERNYVLDEPTQSGDFILSDKSEAALIREGKRGGLVYLGFGAIFTLAGAGVVAAAWLAA